jgi:hypothetical protein
MPAGGLEVVGGTISWEILEGMGCTTGEGKEEKGEE